jgi:hypothetical protein
LCMTNTTSRRPQQGSPNSPTANLTITLASSRPDHARIGLSRGKKLPDAVLIAAAPVTSTMSRTEAPMLGWQGVPAEPNYRPVQETACPKLYKLLVCETIDPPQVLGITNWCRTPIPFGAPSLTWGAPALTCARVYS